MMPMTHGSGVFRNPFLREVETAAAASWLTALFPARGTTNRPRRAVAGESYPR